MKEHLETINCLDKGFVRLVDYMGDDAAIVQAARVSYGEGTKTVREDKGLINYLMRNRHTSPFEMVEFKFHCKMPIFVARQWIRHRTANVNEESGRYSVLKNEFYVPEVGSICAQSKNNKQGRENEAIDLLLANAVQAHMIQSQDESYHEYEEYLEDGLARELARVNLPLSTYTSWYWKIDLHNLLHFLGLRMDSHAQYEIRVFANAMAELIKPIVPFTWEAFEEHILGGVRFSASEMDLLKNMVLFSKDQFYRYKDNFDVQLTDKQYNEFMSKIGLYKDV